MARNDLWTCEQLIMALNVYFKIPFKDVKEKHPLIQKFAERAGKKVEDTLGADIQKLPQGRERDYVCIAILCKTNANMTT